MVAGRLLAKHGSMSRITYVKYASVYCHSISKCSRTLKATSSHSEDGSKPRWLEKVPNAALVHEQLAQRMQSNSTWSTMPVTSTTSPPINTSAKLLPLTSGGQAIDQSWPVGNICMPTVSVLNSGRSLISGTDELWSMKQPGPGVVHSTGGGVAILEEVCSTDSGSCISIEMGTGPASTNTSTNTSVTPSATSSTVSLAAVKMQSTTNQLKSCLLFLPPGQTNLDRCPSNTADLCGRTNEVCCDVTNQMMVDPVGDSFGALSGLELTPAMLRSTTLGDYTDDPLIQTNSAASQQQQQQQQTNILMDGILLTGQEGRQPRLDDLYSNEACLLHRCANSQMPLTLSSTESDMTSTGLIHVTMTTDAHGHTSTASTAIPETVNHLAGNYLLMEQPSSLMIPTSLVQITAASQGHLHPTVAITSPTNEARVQLTPSQPLTQQITNMGSDKLSVTQMSPLSSILHPGVLEHSIWNSSSAGNANTVLSLSTNPETVISPISTGNILAEYTLSDLALDAVLTSNCSPTTQYVIPHHSQGTPGILLPQNSISSEQMCSAAVITTSVGHPVDSEATTNLIALATVPAASPHFLVTDITVPAASNARNGQMTSFPTEISSPSNSFVGMLSNSNATMSDPLEWISKRQDDQNKPIATQPSLQGNTNANPPTSWPQTAEFAKDLIWQGSIQQPPATPQTSYRGPSPLIDRCNLEDVHKAWSYMWHGGEFPNPSDVHLAPLLEENTTSMKATLAWRLSLGNWWSDLLLRRVAVFAMSLLGPLMSKGMGGGLAHETSSLGEQDEETWLTFQDLLWIAKNRFVDCVPLLLIACLVNSQAASSSPQISGQKEPLDPIEESHDNRSFGNQQSPLGQEVSIQFLCSSGSCAQKKTISLTSVSRLLAGLTETNPDASCSQKYPILQYLDAYILRFTSFLAHDPSLIGTFMVLKLTDPVMGESQLAQPDEMFRGRLSQLHKHFRRLFSQAAHLVAVRLSRSSHADGGSQPFPIVSQQEELTARRRRAVLQEFLTWSRQFDAVWHRFQQDTWNLVQRETADVAPRYDLICSPGFRALYSTGKSLFTTEVGSDSLQHWSCDESQGEEEEFVQILLDAKAELCFQS